MRSMQIRGDFRVRKNGGGGRFTGFAQTFDMHRRYSGRSSVLRLQKEGFVEVVEGVTLVDSRSEAAGFFGF